MIAAASTSPLGSRCRAAPRAERRGIGDDTTFALIASLLGIAGEHAQTLNDLAPAQRKRRTFDALIAWLHADARSHPLVVVVEDLHWIDASTRELFGTLLERIAELPVLVVLTFRPEFVPTWPIHGQISMIALTRLPADQSRGSREWHCRREGAPTSRHR